MIKQSMTKTANINVRLYPKLKAARWNDPESLAALEESNQILANPSAYKSFKSAEELFADLDGEEDEV